MIHQARLRRLYVSELPASSPVSQAAPSLSASPLPHDDVNVTAAGDGLEVSVADRYRMTTDD